MICQYVQMVVLELVHSALRTMARTWSTKRSGSFINLDNKLKGGDRAMRPLYLSQDRLETTYPANLRMLMMEAQWIMLST